MFEGAQFLLSSEGVTTLLSMEGRTTVRTVVTERNPVTRSGGPVGTRGEREEVSFNFQGPLFFQACINPGRGGRRRVVDWVVPLISGRSERHYQGRLDISFTPPHFPQ